MLTRKQARQKRRQARKDARHQRRLEKMGVRTQRAMNRQGNREVAYANGIDPNAWVGDVTKFASTAAISIAGASAAKSLGGKKSMLDPGLAFAEGDAPTNPRTNISAQSMLPILAAGAAAYLILKK